MAHRTLVLGIGNPSHRDDAVGLWVVRRLRERGAPSGCVVEEHARGWLDAVDRMIGFDRAILVDAVCGDRAPGTLVEIALEDLGGTPGRGSAMAHGIGLVEALEVARTQELELPGEIRVLGIQVGDLETFSEVCSPALEPAIDRACDVVLRWCSDPPGPTGHRDSRRDPGVRESGPVRSGDRRSGA